MTRIQSRERKRTNKYSARVASIWDEIETICWQNCLQHTAGKCDCVEVKLTFSRGKTKWDCIFSSLWGISWAQNASQKQDMTRLTDLSLNHFTSIKIIDSNDKSVWMARGVSESDNKRSRQAPNQKALQTTIKRHYESILCSFSVQITRFETPISLRVHRIEWRIEQESETNESHSPNIV